MENDDVHQVLAESTGPTFIAINLVLEEIAFRAGLDMDALIGDLDKMVAGLAQSPQTELIAVATARARDVFRRRSETRKVAPETAESPRGFVPFLVVDNPDRTD